MATPKPTLNPMNADPQLILVATTVAMILGFAQLYTMCKIIWRNYWLHLFDLICWWFIYAGMELVTVVKSDQTLQRVNGSC